MIPRSSLVLFGNAPSSGYCELIASAMQASTMNVPVELISIVFLKSLGCQICRAVKGSQLIDIAKLTATLSTNLELHFLDVATAAQCTPPARLPFGMAFKTSLHAACTWSRSAMLTLK